MWDLGRKGQELELELLDPSLHRQLELAAAEVVDIQSVVQRGVLP
jgi:hypothetical protein